MIGDEPVGYALCGVPEWPCGLAHRGTPRRACPTALAALILFSAISSALSQTATPRAAEDDHYRLIRFPMQERIVLEAGALELLPDGRLAVATRRGEIYLIDKPLADNPEDANF